MELGPKRAIGEDPGVEWHICQLRLAASGHYAEFDHYSLSQLSVCVTKWKISSGEGNKSDFSSMK